MNKTKADQVRTMMKMFVFMTLKYYRKKNKWVGIEQAKRWPS